ncbi:MAG: Formate dehydrogenase-O, major subunit, partial [Acidimicrobiales bacterium]|nr:Formate dehydrogenase-O, major subunit [Acidimicrobiales bacterium]
SPVKHQPTDTVHRVTCPLFECMCGLDIHVAAPSADPSESQRVTLVRGARTDVWSKGYICPKGSALGHLHEDPDRLRVPMVRDGEVWREVTWEEAFQRCEELIHPIIERDGPGAFTAFVGNPAGHSYSLSRYLSQMILPSGMPHIYSAGTVDQWPKNVTSILLYGNQWMIPVPDVSRTDYWLLMGGNPHASGGSLMAQPDVLAEIEAIRSRGGKVVVIDPRRTRTADVADEWIGIQPGTDAAWLMAIINVYFERGWIDLGHLAGMVEGVAELREACAEFTPEAVATLTRIDAETTRRIAAEIHDATAASIYGRIGLCNQEFGTLASWLVDVLAIVSGHFDRPGTLMFANPIPFPLAWLPSTKANGMPSFGRWHSRVRGAPEVLGQVPASCLAEEIATPGRGQIKGLINVAANPVLSVPDSARLEEALPELECMIAIDTYLNETTRHANVILPGPSPIETPHFDELLWGFAARSVGKWTDAVFPLDRPDEWEILIRLGLIMSGKHDADTDVAAVDDQWFTMLCYAKGLDPANVLPLYKSGGPERIIDWSIRVGPFGDGYGTREGLTLADFKAEPDGIDRGPAISRAAEIVCTPDGKIHLTHEYLLSDIPRLRQRLAAPVDGLVLVSRRHLRSKNTWLHNVSVLVNGKERCTLMINPADAARLGVADGSVARISSTAGSIVVQAEITEEMLSGIVSLPHGWGHDKAGTRLSIAREHAGVNSNLLAPGEFVDALSGNAAVNGIPVEVAPA